MTAVDHDDAEEGNNANIVYMIEKNALEEDSGKAIFEIDQSTGLIRTALCCLDREKTSDYSIEVVAIDGGGLKGIYILVYCCEQLQSCQITHFLILFPHKSKIFVNLPLPLTDQQY